MIILLPRSQQGIFLTNDTKSTVSNNHYLELRQQRRGSMKSQPHQRIIVPLPKNRKNLVNSLLTAVPLDYLIFRFKIRFAAALIPRLSGNSIPGYTTRAPPMKTQSAVRVWFELATDGILELVLAYINTRSHFKVCLALGRRFAAALLQR